MTYTTYQNDRLARLSIDLVDKVPALQLGMMVNAIAELYFFSVWLSKAENYTETGFFPDTYSLSAEESLWVRHLEIGTPNSVTFEGIAKHITIVTALIVSVISVPKAFVDFLNSYVDFQKQQVEIEINLQELENLKAERRLTDAQSLQILSHLEEAETKMRGILRDYCLNPQEVESALKEIDIHFQNVFSDYSRLDFSQKARELHENGKISDKALEHKLQRTPELIRDVYFSYTVMKPIELGQNPQVEVLP